MNRLSMAGRVVAITGAASGIGRAAALLLASREAKIVAADIDVGGAEETVRLIEGAGGEACFLKTDVSIEEDVARLVTHSIDRFGGLHGALNNAAIVGARRSLTDISLDEWRRTVGINLTGVFLCMKYEIAHMVKAGGGAIVNVSSGAGLVGVPGVADYVATKHGVVGLTRAAAAEYGLHKVRINALLPGAVHSQMLGGYRAAAPPPSDTPGNGRLLGRIGAPEELAEAAAWLLSDAASYATGAAFAVDGGYTAV